MCDWKKWIWPGLLATVLLTVLAVWWKGPVVEQDLADRTKAELNSGYGWAEISMDGRDLTLNGTAPSEADRDKAMEMARSVYGVRIAMGDTKLVSEHSPYIFSAEKTDSKIVLSGFVPNDAEKSATLEAAKAASGGLEVVDNLQLGRGAPAGFTDATAFAIGQLGRFSKGKASLSNLDLSVEGVASSTQNYQAAVDELGGALPNGLKLASRNISPVGKSPYDWAADYDGANLKLSGYVPSNEARDEIVDQARKALPKAEIDDRMEIAAGAGDVYMPAIGFVLQRFGELNKGNASLSDAKLSLSGQASSVENYDAALKALDSALPANLTLGDASITPAEVSGYMLSAVKAGNEIMLEGFAPDEAASSAIEAAAKSANEGATILNKLKLAGGVPTGMDWGKAGGFAVSSLKGLVSGKAGINDSKLSVEGIAASLDSYASTQSLLKGSLEGGLSLGDDKVLPPAADPYQWSVNRGSDKVMIKGNVPSTETGEANIAFAKKIYGTDKVEADQILASGAPAGFGDAVTLAMQITGRLSASQATISGQSLMLKGEADSQASADVMRNELKSNLPAGFDLKEEITAKITPTPEPSPAKVDCQQLFNDALSKEKIEFESAKAVLASSSTGILDKLASAAKSCPDTHIEVSGHTDATGSEKLNKRLSEERAKAVVSFLEKAGIAADRLTAKGYGADRPIGDNKTEEGKAQNRRIEFRVMK